MVPALLKDDRGALVVVGNQKLKSFGIKNEVP